MDGHIRLNGLASLAHGVAEPRHQTCGAQEVKILQAPQLNAQVWALPLLRARLQNPAHGGEGNDRLRIVERVERQPKARQHRLQMLLPGSRKFL